jgi:hypothetical protein
MEISYEMEGDDVIMKTKRIMYGSVIAVAILFLIPCVPAMGVAKINNTAQTLLNERNNEMSMVQQQLLKLILKTSASPNTNTVLKKQNDAVQVSGRITLPEMVLFYFEQIIRTRTSPGNSATYGSEFHVPMCPFFPQPSNGIKSFITSMRDTLIQLLSENENLNLVPKIVPRP